MVASISLVELTGQISAVDAANRAEAGAAPPPPVDLPAPALARRDASPRLSRHDRPPQRDTAAAEAPPAAAALVGGDKPVSVAPSRPRLRSVVNASAPASVDSDTAGRATEPPADGDSDGQGDEVPPEHPSQAILWWRANEPALTVSQIAARVGRSERTVRRVLDAAATPALSQQLLTAHAEAQRTAR